MIGGIFLEIPFGEIYKVEKVSRIRKNLNTLLGFTSNYFTKGNFDKMIVEQLISVGKKGLSRHRSSVSRDHYHRSSDLIRSTVLGVFKDGRWTKDYYRFDSKQAEEQPPLKKHDWNLDERAVEFLSSYRLQDSQSRFSVVIASTAPYSVRLEMNTPWGNLQRYGGYNLAVLKRGVNRIASELFNLRPNSQKGKAIYGYIFEKTGGVQTVKNY